MEIVNDHYSIRDTEYDNFMLRPKIYHRTRSLTFQIFLPMIAVNHTQIPIELITKNKKYVVPPFTNTCITPLSSKMQILVEDHEPSNMFSA